MADHLPDILITAVYRVGKRGLYCGRLVFSALRGFSTSSKKKKFTSWNHYSLFSSHVKPVKLSMEWFSGEPGRHAPSQRKHLPAPGGKHTLLFITGIQSEVKFWKSEIHLIIKFWGSADECSLTFNCTMNSSPPGRKYGWGWSWR